LQVSFCKLPTGVYGLGGSDSIVESSVGGGIDTVVSPVTYTLGDTLENLTLEASILHPLEGHRRAAATSC
jgi:hypothetical protein